MLLILLAVPKHVREFRGHRASLVGKVIDFCHTQPLVSRQKGNRVIHNTYLMSRDEETLYHSVLIWHQSELFYTECKPGLSLAEGREGNGKGRLKHSVLLLSQR